MSGSVCLHVYLRMSAAVSVYVSEETLGIDLCYYTVLCLVYTQCKSVYMNTHTHTQRYEGPWAQCLVD